MRWFSRTRASRFPADMLRRMETFGRYEWEPHSSDLGAGEVRSSVAPFRTDARTDPDGFLADLRTAVAGDLNGFATFGAASLVWELYGAEAVRTPAAWPLIDAGIDFKLVRGLPCGLTGHEWQRQNARREGR